jgi:hypothetical protein
MCTADQRNAGGPEPRIVGRARNLRAEFGGEFAMYGRAVHADLFKQPAAHDRHHPAAALGAGVVGALPRRAHEASGVARIERGGRLVLKPLERRADVVAQRFEPVARPLLALLDQGYVQFSNLSFRHCEPPGRREAPQDDRLREAIHRAAAEWIASSRSLSSGAHSRDPLAPRNDGEPGYPCGPK